MKLAGFIVAWLVVGFAPTPWNTDAAASSMTLPGATLSADPNFTVGVSALPASVAVGGSAGLKIAVTSLKRTKVLVDVEIYAPDGVTKVSQTAFDNQRFAAGQQRTYAVAWPVPATSAVGTYAVAIGIFSPGWVTLQSWTNPAATFAVTAAPVTPSFTASASVGSTSVAAGGSVSLNVAVTSATATTALVDVEIYAPDGATRVSQTAFDNQTFAAGQQRTYAVTWPVPATGAIGTYTVAIGVFSPGWVTLYSWTSPATTFAVVAAPVAPSFTASASVVPTSLAAGGTVSLNVAVTSATATSVLVDVEIYAPDGATKVAQTAFDNQSFAAGQQRTYPVSWPVPATAAIGTYAVAVGIFSPGWVTLNSWTNSAGTFAVTAPAPPPAPAPGVSALHVQGNLLVNSAGTTVVLHGVNRSGTEYACIQGWGIFDGPNDQASIQAIKSWRTNSVRIPLNEDCWLSINGAAAAFSGATYQQAIKDYVGLLNQNGLYALLELHWSAPGTLKATGQNPMPDLDHSVTFWSQVASAFKGNDAVILEMFNEPFPDGNQDTVAGWTCWRDGGTCAGQSYQAAGMQTLVNAVRATGATNVIALGGLQYSNALSQWLTFKPTDPLNNLAAAWHVYNFNLCNNVTCYDSRVGVVAALVPVLATEIGDSTCDAAFLNTLMNWLDARQTGYLAWTWDTWGAACGAIALISDYSGTPTTFGQIYKTHLGLLP